MGSELQNFDADWDYPLTDEDLQAIDAAVAAAAAAAAPQKLDSVSCADENGTSIDSPLTKRRRLPDSLFLFQHSSSSLSPCYRNRFSTSKTTASPSSSFPDIKFGGRIIYSRTMEEAEKAAAKLLDFVEMKKREEGQCVLGLDIEWRPTFERGVAPGKAAVIQICGDNSSCFVFHIIHSQITGNLQNFLEDPSCKKVGVGIANDGAKISFDYNVSTNNLEDLSDIANRKLGGYAKKWSLSSLTETLVCRKLPKPNKIRLGNWEVKVLSKEQLNYAATDAYVSWYLYQALETFPDPMDEKGQEMAATLK